MNVKNFTLLDYAGILFESELKFDTKKTTGKSADTPTSSISKTKKSGYDPSQDRGKDGRWVDTGNKTEANKTTVNQDYVNIIKRGREQTRSIAAAKTEGEKFKAVSDLFLNLKKNGLSAQESANIVLSKQLDDNLSQNPEVRKKTLTSAAEFFQISRGLGSKSLQKFEQSEPRAFATGGLVNVGSSPSKSIIFHELGHHMEYSDPKIKDAANEFLRLRRKSDTVQSMNKLTNSKKYGKNETGYEGKFVHPYVGKVSPLNRTEVVSIGMQHFTSPGGMMTLYNKDRSHFEFIAGILTRNG